MDLHEALSAIQSATQVMFSAHARQRMNQRNVTRADVRHVLNHAVVDALKPGDEPDTWVVQGTDLDEETLNVVLKIEVLLTGNARNVVLTVY